MPDTSGRAQVAAVRIEWIASEARKLDNQVAGLTRFNKEELVAAVTAVSEGSSLKAILDSLAETAERVRALQTYSEME